MEVRVDAFDAPRTGTTKTGNNYFIQSVTATKLGYTQDVVRFEVFGEDRWKMMSLQIGKTYTIKFDVVSRPYVSQDGRTSWNTNVRVYAALPLNV